MNKPIYVCQAIIDLSKTLFDFHYNYNKAKYGEKAELLFTYTDSLIYSSIETKDFYQDIAKDVKKKFDTSEYPEKHSSGIKSGVNKKEIGKFKDEAAGKQITHFVGPSAKLYSFKLEGEN